MAAIPQKIGKYQVESVLGRGGMGEVYKAHDSALGRFVALKVMRGPALDDTNARERFIREAQSAGGLRHPNIVTVYDLGEYEDRMYIAMEFIHGEDLEHLIKKESSPDTGRQIQHHDSSLRRDQLCPQKPDCPQRFETFEYQD